MVPEVPEVTFLLRNMVALEVQVLLMIIKQEYPKHMPVAVAVVRPVPVTAVPVVPVVVVTVPAVEQVIMRQDTVLAVAVVVLVPQEVLVVMVK